MSNEQRGVEMQDTVRTDLMTSNIKEHWAQDRKKWNRLCKTHHTTQREGGER